MPLITQPIPMRGIIQVPSSQQVVPRNKWPAHILGFDVSIDEGAIGFAAMPGETTLLLQSSICTLADADTISTPCEPGFARVLHRCLDPTCSTSERLRRRMRFCRPTWRLAVRVSSSNNAGKNNKG